MGYIAKLDDGSEKELDCYSWTQAAEAAVRWHREVSHSACYTRWDNPVQIKSIERES